jgi:hypothetical protein
MLIALTLVSWIACPDAALACCGTYDPFHVKDEEVQIWTPPELKEEGVFRHSWMLKGVDEFTAISASGKDKNTPKSDVARDVTELFADMWSSPPFGGKGIWVTEAHFPYCTLPSTLPPFDIGWLTDAVWPRTRSHLTGEFDRSVRGESCCGEP